jgi:flap endonuclease-1
MGVKGMGKFLRKYGTIKDVKNYTGKRVAIDTSIFLYKFSYKSTPKEFLNRFIGQIKSFRSNGITPIYVFDGFSPIEKEATCEKRRQSKKINITESNIENLKKVFECLCIEYITAPTEAEKFCAFLNFDGHVDLVLSNDFDSITFGCKVLLTNPSPGKYIEYDSKKILNELGITLDQYIEVCIACGCDYYPTGIHGIGQSKALSFSDKIENWGVLVPEDLDLNGIRKLFNDFNDYYYHTKNPQRIEGNIKALLEILIPATNACVI